MYTESSYIYIYIIILCTCKIVMCTYMDNYLIKRLMLRSHDRCEVGSWNHRIALKFDRRLRCACEISERLDDAKSRGFQSSRDLTMRHLFGYWDGAQMSTDRYMGNGGDLLPDRFEVIIQNNPLSHSRPSDWRLKCQPALKVDMSLSCNAAESHAHRSWAHRWQNLTMAHDSMSYLITSQDSKFTRKMADLGYVIFLVSVSSKGTRLMGYKLVVARYMSGKLFTVVPNRPLCRHAMTPSGDYRS